MDNHDKKTWKAEIKLAKKQAKAQEKLGKATGKDGVGPVTDSPVVLEPPTEPPGSKMVLFAEAVRGILFIIFAVSLLIAILLSHKGIILTTNQIIALCLDTIIGKIILSVIALATFIYGLKCLRAIK
ncbi:MAG: hypothetical protein K9M57_10175 [Phycisphaerae bacterium]|nr:hypothetical protein [Phycisphaerae bacterium]